MKRILAIIAVLFVASGAAYGQSVINASPNVVVEGGNGNPNTNPKNVNVIPCTVTTTEPSAFSNNDRITHYCKTEGELIVAVKDGAGNVRYLAVDSSGRISTLSDPSTAANWGIYVEDAAETAGGNLMMAGTVRRDTPASSANTSGDNATFNTDANGNLWVTMAPTTAGGSTPCSLQSAASTNATNCKASAGQIYQIDAVNTTSTLYYLRLYNSSGTPTCSSATGFVRTIPIPHASGAGGGITISIPAGETYSTGIAFCFTGGGSSTDNTNAATGVYLNIDYK